MFSKLYLGFGGLFVALLKFFIGAEQDAAVGDWLGGRRPGRS